MFYRLYFAMVTFSVKKIIATCHLLSIILGGFMVDDTEGGKPPPEWGAFNFRACGFI